MRFALLILSLALSAAAQTFNVDTLIVRRVLPVVDSTNGIFADSVSGNDANTGTSNSPIATIARVTELATTATNIYLKAGSFWREELVVTNSGTTISRYGTGANPMLAADEIISGSWSNTTNNVWEKQLVWDGGTAWFSVWENSNRLVRATSLENCDTNPGSYFPASDSASPVIVYVHATSSDDPSSNGKVYEYAKRTSGFHGDVYNDVTNTTLVGVDARRQAGNDGSIVLNGTVRDCWALDGTKHNFLVYPGSWMESCVASNWYYTAASAIPIVAYKPTGAGENTTITNCVIKNATQDPTSVGIYQHPSSGYFGRIKILNCRIENVGTGLSPLSRHVEVTDTVITNVLTGISSDNLGLFLTNVIISADKETAGSPTDVGVYLAGGSASTNFIVNCNFNSSGTDYALRAAGSVATVLVLNSQFAGTYALNAPTGTTSGNPLFTVRSNTFSGTSWFIQYTNQCADADYNSYASSTFISSDIGTVNFANWKANTGQDANSTNP